MNRQSLALVLVMILAAGAPLAELGTPPASSPSTPPPALAAAFPDFGRLPLAFEPNAGQSDPQVQFLAHSPAGMVFFTPGEVVLALKAPVSDTLPAEGRRGAHLAAPAAQEPSTPPASAPGPVLRLSFVGASSTVTLAGDEMLPGRVNYFQGNDPSQWHADLPTYARVTYTELYPGISLAYTGGGGHLKGTYTVAPGADPDRIRWHYEGASGVRLDEASNLRIELAASDGSCAGILLEQAPVAWQEIGGERIAVAARYALSTDGSASFVLGKYNRTLPLVLDPVLLVYSTYLGGTSYDEGYGVAVDAAGSAHVTGYTTSTNFPTLNAFQGTNAGNKDVFVTKFSPDGTALVYSTYLGGMGDDWGNGIALDAASSAYVTGHTDSTNFPTLNAFQGTLGWHDAFVTKFSPDGTSLVYSTYLGGTDWDEGLGIAVDATGRTCVTGWTRSDNFPTHNAFQSTYGWYGDAFVTKFSPEGTVLIYSTYLGGAGDDRGNGIALDAVGSAYVTGWTNSPDFPTYNAFQGANAGNLDAFVAKFSPDGMALIYSTYLGGGPGGDAAYGIAVDEAGSAYVMGDSFSTNFPTLNAFQGTNAGGADVFVTKFSPDGTALVYSTYLGGTGDDWGSGIAVDSVSSAYVTGETYSPDFPTYNAFQGANAGNVDAFVAKFNPGTATLIYSTFLGSTDTDRGYGIAVDAAGSAYLTGLAGSPDFPLQNPFQGTSAGAVDAFVTKLGIVTTLVDTGFRPDPHGYSFSNGDGAWGRFPLSAYDFRYEDLVRMFGQDAVCWRVGSACIVKPSADLWHIQANSLMNGGHCDGFTTTGLRFFEGLDDPSTFQQGASTAHDLSLSNARRHIAYFWALQIPDPVAAARYQALQDTPSQVLDQLMVALAGGVPDLTTLLVYSSDRRLGHSITPYAIEDHGNGIYWVQVYDNNHPDDATRHVEINTTANTWSYVLDSGWTWTGDASTHSLGAIPVSLYSQQAVCPWCSQSGNASGPPAHEVWLAGQGRLLITDADGRRIGYVNGQYVNEIPGAFGSVVPGGMGMPAEPLYSVPLTATYSVLLDGQVLTQTQTVTITQFGPNHAIQLGRVSLDPGAQDQLTAAADGTLVAYRPGSGREADLSLARDSATGSYQFQILGAEVGASEAVTVVLNTDTSLMAFSNAQASGGLYDLSIKRLSAMGDQRFLHTGITILATDTHYLDYGIWNGFGALTLLVDHGSNGTIDETLALDNQAGKLYLPFAAGNH